MGSRYFIKGFRCFFHGFCKTAWAIITTPIIEWISKDPCATQMSFTERAYGAIHCLKCGWPVSCCVAEYKTAKGEIFIFRLPLPDSEYVVRGFKECFRIISRKELVRLKHFQEAGLPYTIRMFCNAYNAKDEKCDGCRLLDTSKRVYQAKGNTSSKERQHS